MAGISLGDGMQSAEGNTESLTLNDIKGNYFIVTGGHKTQSWIPDLNALGKKVTDNFDHLEEGRVCDKTKEYMVNGGIKTYFVVGDSLESVEARNQATSDRYKNLVTKIHANALHRLFNTMSSSTRSDMEVVEEETVMIEATLSERGIQPVMTEEVESAEGGQLVAPIIDMTAPCPVLHLAWQGDMALMYTRFEKLIAMRRYTERDSELEYRRITVRVKSLMVLCRRRGDCSTKISDQLCKVRDSFRLGLQGSAVADSEIKSDFASEEIKDEFKTLIESIYTFLDIALVDIRIKKNIEHWLDKACKFVQIQTGCITAVVELKSDDQFIELFKDILLGKLNALIEGQIKECVKGKTEDNLKKEISGVCDHKLAMEIFEKALECLSVQVSCTGEDIRKYMSKPEESSERIKIKIEINKSLSRDEELKMCNAFEDHMHELLNNTRSTSMRESVKERFSELLKDFLPRKEAEDKQKKCFSNEDKCLVAKYEHSSV